MAKKPETLQVKVRMPKDLHRRIQREADKKGQTINAEILGRLENSFHVEGMLSKIEKSVRESANSIRKVTAEIDKAETVAIAAGVNVDNELDVAAGRSRSKSAYRKRLFFA